MDEGAVVSRHPAGDARQETRVQLSSHTPPPAVSCHGRRTKLLLVCRTAGGPGLRAKANPPVCVRRRYPIRWRRCPRQRRPKCVELALKRRHGVPHQDGWHYWLLWYVLWSESFEQRRLKRPRRLEAAMGTTFALTESVVANQRQTDDALNGAAGGCAAGFLAGIRGM